MAIKLGQLGYAFDALEPFMDAKTVEIHYTKHHQGYVDKLNTALEGYTDLQKMAVEELLKNINAMPKGIRNAVQNNAGGHANHAFLWSILKKGNKPGDEILEAINRKYSNFDTFKKEFSAAAASFFGSGWVWLVLDEKGELEIMPTPGHESPLQKGKTPLLVIDVWEHAYYLKYQNRRAEFIEAFFNIINWDAVNDAYKKFSQKKK